MSRWVKFLEFTVLPSVKVDAFSKIMRPSLGKLSFALTALTSWMRSVPCSLYVVSGNALSFTFGCTKFSSPACTNCVFATLFGSGHAPSNLLQFAREVGVLICGVNACVYIIIYIYISHHIHSSGDGIASPLSLCRGLRGWGRIS